MIRGKCLSCGYEGKVSPDELSCPLCGDFSFKVREMTEIEKIRAITRPVLTVLGLIFWGSFIGAQIDYPDAFQWAVIVMLAWYFGENMLRRRK